LKTLKTFWKRRNDGIWYGADIKSIDLKGGDVVDDDFYAVRDDLVLTHEEPRNDHTPATCSSAIVGVKSSHVAGTTRA
jgi:hypothetical protein